MNVRFFVLCCLLVLPFVACTDYVGDYEDLYGHLENESSSSFDKKSFVAEGYSSSSSSYRYSSGASSSSWYSSSSWRYSQESSVSSSSSISIPSSSSFVSGFKGSYGVMVDSRDDKVYRTVSIGDQEWMAENLGYTGVEHECRDDKPSNCDIYGAYYWTTSVQIYKVCPEGWNVPTLGQWELLVNYAKAKKGSIYYDDALKSDTLWSLKRQADVYNSLGFAALPLGMADEWGSPMGMKAHFWTSSAVGTYDLDDMDVWIYTIENTAEAMLYRTKDIRMPVRCIKNDMRMGQMLDERDSTIYKTVKIGSQTWMAENLNYEDPDGESYCRDFNLDSCLVYGRLYSWNAAQKACPTGWRLPEKMDFESLLDTVKAHAGDFGVGEGLMAVGKWGRLNARDFYGFNAIPAGFRRHDIFSKTDYALFWGSTNSVADDGETSAHVGLYLSNQNKDVNLDPFADDLYEASVRCIME